MKKGQLFLNAVFGVALVGLVFLHFNNTKNKVAYIDSSKMLNEYLGMKDAREKYQLETQGWSANVDSLTRSVQNSIMEYEKSVGSMTVKEKDLSKELIRRKQKQLVDYQRAVQEKARIKDNEITKNVLVQVNAFIKTYGEKNGYTIILAATEYGNLAYAQESIDITDSVIKGLNEAYSGE